MVDAVTQFDASPFLFHVTRLLVGTPSSLLAVGLLHPLHDLESDPTHSSSRLQNGRDCLQDLLSLSVARPRRRELQSQLRQLQQGALDLLMTGCGVEFGLAGAVAPDQPIPLGAQDRRLGNAVAINDLAVLVPLLMNQLPGDATLKYRLAERGVLRPGTGKDREESAAVLMEVRHVLGAGELAVGHVKEVTSPG